MLLWGGIETPACLEYKIIITYKCNYLTFRFLATGDSFQTIAFSFRLGHSTVHNIVKDVCVAIIDKLLVEVMPLPKEEDWEKIGNDFWNIWNFPNCLGALDGKHVEIFAPPNSGSQFYNYKRTFSIVLMALVDANYKFIAVDVGAYGKNSDGGIFANSSFGKALEKNKLNVPKDRNLPGTQSPAPFVIVGDEAFPLKPYLLRPYPGSTINGDVEKQIFNYRLSRARRVSENAFGNLVQKFRIYFRSINLFPENVDKVILTTCILHNYIKDNILMAQHFDPIEGEPNWSNLPRQGGNANNSAFYVRETYKTFFNSDIGSLAWQKDKFV